MLFVCSSNALFIWDGVSADCMASSNVSLKLLTLFTLSVSILLIAAVYAVLCLLVIALNAGDPWNASITDASFKLIVAIVSSTTADVHAGSAMFVDT